jgi:hypothetical protein
MLPNVTAATAAARNAFFIRLLYINSCGAKIVTGMPDHSPNRTKHICLLFNAPEACTSYKCNIRSHRPADTLCPPAESGLAPDRIVNHRRVQLLGRRSSYEPGLPTENDWLCDLFHRRARKSRMMRDSPRITSAETRSVPCRPVSPQPRPNPSLSVECLRHTRARRSPPRYRRHRRRHRFDPPLKDAA